MDNQTRYTVLVVFVFVTVIISWQLYNSLMVDSSDIRHSKQQTFLLDLLVNFSESGDWLDPVIEHSNKELSLHDRHPLNSINNVIGQPSTDMSLFHMIKNISSFQFVAKDEGESKIQESVILAEENSTLSKSTSSNHSNSNHDGVDVVHNQVNASGVAVHFSTEPYSAFWVKGDVPFLQRIQMYNLAIAKIRDTIKLERGYKPWTDPLPSPYVLWGSRDDFLEQLSNFTHVKTVALSWIKSNTTVSSQWQNLLIEEYYRWVASEPLCTWIRSPGETKARWDAVYNRSCTSDLRDGTTKLALEPVYLHGKPINPNHYWPNNGNSYPNSFYTTPPPHVLYLHIAEDAVITSVGDIFSGSLKIVPYSCSHDLTPSKPDGYDHMPIYTEVFIMTGHWGTAHFHKSIELLPRIAPYLAFLIKYQDIMIQVSEPDGRTATILNILGITRDRLVTGTIRTKIAYMPQATPCGFAQVQELQILSRLYRDHIKHITKNVTGAKSLVMVHRSGQRRLTNALHVELLVRKLAVEYGLNFHLYHDQQLPSLEDTMIMFNQAAVVVAPHGAGGSNLLFCQPGTFVVEAVCNRPHVNLCFQRVAHVLGLRYHAIPSDEGCEDHINVNSKLIEYVIRVKLEQWQILQRQSNTVP